MGNDATIIPLYLCGFENVLITNVTLGSTPGWIWLAPRVARSSSSPALVAVSLWHVSGELITLIGYRLIHCISWLTKRITLLIIGIARLFHGWG